MSGLSGQCVPSRVWGLKALALDLQTDGVPLGLCITVQNIITRPRLCLKGYASGKLIF